MRLYECEDDVSDRNARTWWIGMHRHGGLAHASMSYNVKRKSCNRKRIQELIKKYKYKLCDIFDMDETGLFLQVHTYKFLVSGFESDPNTE